MCWAISNSTAGNSTQNQAQNVRPLQMKHPAAISTSEDLPDDYQASAALQVSEDYRSSPESPIARDSQGELGRGQTLGFAGRPSDNTHPCALGQEYRRTCWIMLGWPGRNRLLRVPTLSLYRARHRAMGTCQTDLTEIQGLLRGSSKLLQLMLEPGGASRRGTPLGRNREARTRLGSYPCLKTQPSLV